MAKWAGEDLAKKRGFFRASAIPSGLAPWQFYLGLGLLFVSNFGVFGLVVVERLNPGGGLLSAVNAFTDIANAAMEEKIRSGEIAPWAGTGNRPASHHQFWLATVPPLQLCSPCLLCSCAHRASSAAVLTVPPALVFSWIPLLPPPGHMASLELPAMGRPDIPVHAGR